jgi:nicotinate-nucleotide adenylyltransferase
VKPGRNRFGVFGGTFDPVHRAHVSIAQDCLRQLDLDKVLMIPSYMPPHRDAPLAPAADRLAMVGLAAQEDAALEACDIEVKRAAVSYTIDTVRELKASVARVELVLLMGWDAALEFASWHFPRELNELAHVAVFNRTGSEQPDRMRLLDLGLDADSTIIEVDSPSISASDLRRRIAAGEDVSDWMHPEVIHYIGQHRLYR